MNRLLELHKELERCRLCPNVIGPPVHGAAVDTKVVLIGQAPGPHEGKFGRPFAWTAGKTLFHWFESVVGINEEEFRSRIYMAATIRCFPGKAGGGGDRKPDRLEIQNCQSFIRKEVEILQPELVLPVGTLAIEQVLGTKQPLNQVVGKIFAVDYMNCSVDVIPLPHPSGLSSWHKTEPGKTLLKQALELISRHPAIATNPQDVGTPHEALLLERNLNPGELQ